MNARNTDVLDWLRAHHTMTLATQGEQGVWAAAVFYASDGFDLYFLSKPGARHSGNIARDGRAAVTIQEDCSDWREVKGIQAEGHVVELSGEAAGQARALYGAKYPVVGTLAGAPAAILQALAKVHWYRFVPERLYFIDNSRGFGHRDEIDCRDGRP